MTNGLVGQPTSIINAETAGGLLGLAGLVLLLAARALTRARRWARAPVVLAQLLSIPVGWSMLAGGWRLGGLAVTVIAVAVLVLLLMPSTTAALEN